MIGCIRAVAPYGPAVGTEDAEGFVARSAGVREPLSPASPGTRARAQDRELIAAAPSRGAPSEGGSDAATRWISTGEGSASVPGLPHGSVARPVGGRASRDSGRARFFADGTARGVVHDHPGPGGRVMPGGWLCGHRRCPRLRVG